MDTKIPQSVLDTLPQEISAVIKQRGINTLGLEERWAAVQANAMVLQWVKGDNWEDDRKLYLASVKQDGLWLQFIRRNAMSAEICLTACEQNKLAYQFVPYEMFEWCIDLHPLHWATTQTKDDCLRAVQKNGLALQFVKNQTQEICIAAVQQTAEALQFVKLENRTIDVCCAAAKNRHDGIMARHHVPYYRLSAYDSARAEMLLQTKL